STIKQIQATYGPARVRIVYKHQPLPFHPHARPAAEASVVVFALGGPNAFWHFHDAAFAEQTSLDDEHFERWAVEAGVNRDAFRDAYASKRFADKVDADIALADRVGANGTPAFRINGVTVAGAQPFEKFEEVINNQLAEAQALIAKGTKPGDVYVALTDK